MAPPIDDIVLVDENDRQVGVGRKDEVHRSGQLHRAFSVFIFNHDGQMLLQRRALEKYHSGGLWTNACCGHPAPGESVVDAARRRLSEELGFNCPLESAFQFIYRTDFPNGLIESEYDHVFVGNYDERTAGVLSPNPAEAMAIRWLSPSELVATTESRPADFSSWFTIALPKVLDFVSVRSD